MPLRIEVFDPIPQSAKMDAVDMLDVLAGNAQASKAAMADETSTSPRPLHPTVEEYTSDSGEDSTVPRDFSKDPSKTLNVSWESPEVTKSKAQRSETATYSSQSTTVAPTLSSPTSRLTAREANTAPRQPPIGFGYRVSTTTHQSSDDSNGTEDEQESDEEAGEEWDIMGNEIEPDDSASRPRRRPHAPRPATRASTKIPTPKGGASRKPTTSGAIRQRDHKPSPQRSQHQLKPASYGTSFSSQYAPGHPSNLPYPPGYAPPPPTLKPLNPFSPSNSGHDLSRYAPSILSGATMVPWGYWPAPMHRTPTPPQPPPPPAVMITPPPPPSPVPEPGPTTVIDPIELIETYLAALKESKQKDLLDAGRILTWVDRKLGVGNESTPAANVESYRIHDDDLDASESHASSSEMLEVSPSAPPQSTLGSPDYNGRIRRQMAEERSTVGFLTEPNVSSTRSLYSDNTVRPYQLRNRSNLGDTTSVHDRVDTAHNSKHSHAREYFPERAPETFSIESQVLEQIDILRQDVTCLYQNLSQKKSPWLGSTISSAWGHWKKRFRKAPRPGTRRLEWTCECGEERFADLPITSTTELEEMRTFLTRPAPAIRTVPYSSSNPPDLESGTIHSNLSSSQSTPNSFSANRNTNSSTSESSSTYIGSSSSQSFSFKPGSTTVGVKYLELCVNVGAYETKLAEIKIITDSANSSTICTDGLLFRKIYEHYFAFRGHTWRRLLYRPAGIKFVHFGVESGHRVDLFPGEPLPPEDVIAAKQWEYSPPPIDSRTFLHYFWNHKKHSSARYVGRLPKKLGESLLSCLREEEQREGWGIHIMEGPNKPAICFALLIVLVLSFLTAVVYDVIMKSRDSGFGIGQWMVAALTVALSTLYFSLEDEVTTSFD